MNRQLFKNIKMVLKYIKTWSNSLKMRKIQINTEMPLLSHQFCIWQM